MTFKIHNNVVFSALFTSPACLNASMCVYVYLILLPSALLVIVKHIFPNVLPLAVVRRHMVHTLLQALVSPPAGVEKQAQHQH